LRGFLERLRGFGRCVCNFLERVGQQPDGLL
jgi:hypothetical protein